MCEIVLRCHPSQVGSLEGSWLGPLWLWETTKNPKLVNSALSLVFRRRCMLMRWEIRDGEGLSKLWRDSTLDIYLVSPICTFCFCFCPCVFLALFRIQYWSAIRSAHFQPLRGGLRNHWVKPTHITYLFIHSINIYWPHLWLELGIWKCSRVYCCCCYWCFVEYVHHVFIWTCIIHKVVAQERWKATETI